MQENCTHSLEEIIIKVSVNTWIPSDIGKNAYSDKHAYDSAVLIPMVMHLEELSLLFTLRSSHLERHSGQVSFPGGIIEEGDNSPVETALRETREEIGISAENIKVIGQLPPFNTSTGYIVYPVVGFINSLQQTNRNILEVDRIFCIPLNWLCDPGHSRIKNFISNDGNTREAWFFDLYDGELLWGITAKITHDMLELIKK